jgi:hypothetical protein
MNAKFFILFFISVLFLSSLRAQSCLQYPVSLEQRVHQSSLVIEGLVVEKTSFWNDEHSQILTAYFIEVYKIFKGQQVADTIAIVTQGGQVDMDILKVHPELRFTEGDYGVFMLTGLPDEFRNATIIGSKPQANFYRGYAWSQSFIAIHEGKVHDVFFNYKDNAIQHLYARLFECTQSETYTERKTTPQKFMEITPTIDAKAISSFSPAVITAGTLGPLGILTINGIGFGATQGAGFVRFRNADDGGATFVTVGTALATDYISWSDVQVVVRVPSGSGTGTFQLRNNGGTTFTSATPVSIDYNHLEIIFDPGSGAQRYEPDLINDNGAAAGDYTLTFNTAFFGNAPAVTSFRDALANWVFKTGVNFVDAGATTSAIATNNGADGVNIVSFNAGLGAGILGVSFSSWSGCLIGGNAHWFLNDVDLLFATVPGGSTWYFGCSAAGIALPQFDFESVAVHELGHHHQLGHIINTAGVMHFSIANGQVKRLINTNDDAGGDYVMAHSIVANPCGPAPMTMISGPAPGCAPLPVELISFNAVLNHKNEVDLSWTTVSEINNNYFSVQRSVDLVEFEEVARISGAGNSSTLRTYTAKDPAPLRGTSYYRLEQVDFDGNFSNTTYRVIHLDAENSQNITIIPNPATDFISLRFPDNSYHDIKVFDASGKLVLTDNIQVGDLLNIQSLNNGLYFIQAMGSNGRMSVGKLMVGG